jgi:predicted dehydrogenase
VILSQQKGRVFCADAYEQEGNEPVSRQIHLAIELTPECESVFQAMAQRSRVVQIVDDISACTTLITDKAEVALTAIGLDKHVLVLDPFTLRSETRGVLAASNRAIPALPARFQPSVWQIKQKLDDGKLGEQGLLRIHRWQPSASSLQPTSALECELDLAVWLMGDLPAEVYAVQRPGYLQTHLGFVSHAMALIDIDTAVSEGNAYYSLSLIGSTGAAYADDHHNMNLLLVDGGPKALPTSQRDMGIANMIDAVARGIVCGVEFASDWQQIDAVLGVADQVHSAAASGEVIAGGSRG